LGRKKLGEPDWQVLSQIASISELDRLKLMLDRILEAQDWAHLLASLDA
jgi:hypothetical protein